MKKMILLALAFAISIPTALFAQDDIYQTKAKKVSKKSLYADAASDVWSTNANDDWDVDAYNRRGKIDTSTLDKDGYAASSQKTKVIIEDDDKTVHNDTVIEIITLDAFAPYTWSYRIRRFHNIVFNVIVDPWYNGFNYWGWNPWYGTWNYAYYDPFYNPWAWSGWHGYWDPWYYSWGPSWYYDPFYHSHFNVVPPHHGHFAHNRPSSHRHPEHNRVGRDNFVGGHSNGSMASTRSRNRGGEYATRSNGTHRSSVTRGGGTSGYIRGAGSNGYTRPSSTRGTSSANGNSGYTRQSNRSGSNSNVGGYNGHSRGSSVSRSGNSSSHSSSSGSYSSPSRSSSSSGSYSGGGGFSGGGSRGGGGGGGSHSSGGSRSGGGGRR